MTKEQFIYNYCLLSNSIITREFFDKNLIALPCKCSDPECSGWAAVSQDYFSIYNHVQLYGPDPHIWKAKQLRYR